MDLNPCSVSTISKQAKLYHGIKGNNEIIEENQKRET